MWKTVNNILNCIALRTHANMFTSDGSDTCDSTFIASKLIDYFSKVGETLTEAFDEFDINDISLDYLGEPSHSLLKFEPVY